MKLEDLYFTFFRHKKKIIFFSLLGVAAAAGLYFIRQPAYESTAKLMVRYIIDSRAVNPMGTDREIKSPDSRGSHIINDEIQILQNWNIAVQVARTIGPATLLGPDSQAESPEFAAAGMILKNLTVDVPRNSNILLIKYAHRDPLVARRVLEQLIQTYRAEHAKIHRADDGMKAILERKLQMLGSQLRQSEAALDAKRNEVGVPSIEETRKALIQERSTVHGALLNAEAELAAFQALLNQAPVADAGAGADAAGTNDVEILDPPTPEPAVVSEYESVLERLEFFRTRQNNLLVQFSEANPLVAAMREKIDETAARKKKLEAEHPGLLFTEAAKSDSSGKSAGSDRAVGINQLKAIKARVATYRTQLEDLDRQLTELGQAELAIRDLERTRKLQEEEFTYMQTSLQKHEIDSELDQSGLTNIAVVQSPSPAAPAVDELLKKMAIALALGVFGGIGLAFLLEMYVDQTVKRPSDFDQKLRLPLYMSIPYLNGNGRLRLENGALTAVEDPNEPITRRQRRKNARRQSQPWDPSHRLYGYFEALRDRVVMYFAEMTHKPKLIGVSGCTTKCGTTSIAAGLAATLSETGDGNVLLIDMNRPEGGAHPFFRGKPGSGTGLANVFDEANPESSRVNDHLAIASALPVSLEQRKTLPKHLAELMPRLMATDYDYIIFDMPPVTPTSLTPRIAASMDQVILVVESEKVHRDLVDKTHKLLKRSNANVAAVLNKTKRYLPKSLNPEL